MFGTIFVLLFYVLSLKITIFLVEKKKNTVVKNARSHVLFRANESFYLSLFSQTSMQLLPHRLQHFK